MRGITRFMLIWDGCIPVQNSQVGAGACPPFTWEYVASVFCLDVSSVTLKAVSKHLKSRKHELEKVLWVACFPTKLIFTESEELHVQKIPVILQVRELTEVWRCLKEAGRGLHDTVCLTTRSHPSMSLAPLYHTGLSGVEQHTRVQLQGTFMEILISAYTASEVELSVNQNWSWVALVHDMSKLCCQRGKSRGDLTVLEVKEDDSVISNPWRPNLLA